MSENLYFIFSVAGGLTLSILGLINARYILYSLVVLIPYRTIFMGNMWGIKGASSVNLIYLVALICMVKYIIKKPKEKFFDDKISFFLIIYIFLEFIAYFKYFYVNHYALATFTNWLVNFIKPVQLFSLYFIFASCIQDKKEARNIVFFMLFVTLVMNILQLMHFHEAVATHKFIGLTSPDHSEASRRLEEMHYIRAGNPLFGMTLKSQAFLLLQIVPLFILLCFNPIKNLFFKMFCAFGALTSLLCIALSQVRTVYVGLLTGLVYLAVFVNRRFRKYLVLGLIAIVILALFGFLKVGRFADKGMYKSLADFSGARVPMWGAAVNLLISRPAVILFGGGKAYFEYEHEYSPLLPHDSDVHSGYLNQLITSGILGLVVFIVIIINVIRSQNNFLLKNKDPFFSAVSYSILFYIFASVAMNIFGHAFPVNDCVDSYTWIILGIISRLNQNTIQDDLR